jgi:hypothetical protein
MFVNVYYNAKTGKTIEKIYKEYRTNINTQMTMKRKGYKLVEIYEK